MIEKLWLDDMRSPPDETWAVAKSFAEAKLLFDLHGWPRYVAFDHDLGPWPEPTGHDFAKFLVNKDLDNHTMPADFNFSVHSSNPAGRKNIEALLNGYLEHREKDNGNADAAKASSTGPRQD